MAATQGEASNGGGAIKSSVTNDRRGGEVERLRPKGRRATIEKEIVVVARVGGDGR